MNTNQLQSILVYRLQGEETPVCLTHYQNWPPDRTVDDNCSSPSLPVLVAQTIEKEQRRVPSSGWIEPGRLGGFKVIRSNAHQVVYGRSSGQDDESLVFCVVTGLDFPARFAIQMLHEVCEKQPMATIYRLQTKQEEEDDERPPQQDECFPAADCADDTQRVVESILGEACRKYETLPPLSTKLLQQAVVAECQASIIDDSTTPLKQSSAAPIASFSRYKPIRTWRKVKRALGRWDREGYSSLWFGGIRRG